MDPYVGATGSATSVVNSNTLAITTTRDCPVGSTLLVPIQRQGGMGNVTGITFSVGAATCRNDLLLSSNAGMEGWSCDVTTLIPNGSTVTLTFTNTAASERVAALELFNTLTTTPTDKTATGGASGTTSHPTGTTAATTQAYELAFAVFAFSANAVTVSSITGFTQLTQANGAASGTITSAYQVLSSSGTQTATAITSGNASSDNGIATYKLIAAGLPPGYAQQTVPFTNNQRI